MPAYTPPEQVLFSPITNYYKGKAIRQQLAAGEQDAELRGLQIDLAKQEVEDAPGNKQKAEELWKVQFDTAEANLETSLLENGEKTMEIMAKSLSSLTSAATETAIAGDVEGALEDFNSRIQAQKSAYPKSIADKVKSGAGDDGVYDAEELANLKMALAPWWARDPSDRSPRSVLVDGAPAEVFYDKAGNMYYEDGRPVIGKITPFAVNEGGVVGTDPRTPTQQGAEHQENGGSFNDSSDVQELITSALPRVAELPGSVGITGKFAVGGAGLLTTFGQEDAANAFAEYMSGASPEEIAEIQTELQIIRSRIIPITTGEASARISDNEREIANRTVGVIDSIKGPADLTKAYPQVMGAMTQLYVESWANKYRVASRDGNINYPYDLGNDGETEELIDEFLAAGIEEETIKRALTRLARIQDIQL